MYTLSTSGIFKALTSLCILLSLALYSTDVTAQSAQYRRDKKKTSKKKGDKVDISGVADKYWAPKDTDFSVVQNRTYSKEGKTMLSFGVGPLINDEWTEGQNLSVSVNHFFSERHGVELTYINSSGLQDSDAIRKVQTVGSGTGVAPDYGRIKTHYQLSYNFVPFYAKMSLLDRKIIYFDMVISPGIGYTEYDQFNQPFANSFDKLANRQSTISYSLDISQFYFLSKQWAIRADLRNRWYDEEIIQYNSAGAGGSKLRTDFNNRTIFTMGVMYSF